MIKINHNLKAEFNKEKTQKRTQDDINKDGVEKAQ